MRFAFPVLIGLVGTLILISLGIWQVQRLAWKEAVLAEIDARITDAPVAIPATPDPDVHTYLPVTASGAFTADELHVLVSTKNEGPGFRIITAFETDAGRRIMVDRGFVPSRAKDISRPGRSATIAGNLHWPDEMDSFTPEPSPSENIWFARDVPAMADALKTEPVLMILRESSNAFSEIRPLPVDSRGIPNDHLEYAVTWFGLALVWVLMTGFWLYRRSKG
jgi:surfeit locus 1 family protein